MMYSSLLVVSQSMFAKQDVFKFASNIHLMFDKRDVF